jgi:cytochrome c553
VSDAIPRQQASTRTVAGGCHTCHGVDTPAWQAGNAQALATRHHDATGHPTWAAQTITTQYGSLDPPANQLELT